MNKLLCVSLGLLALIVCSCGNTVEHQEPERILDSSNAASSPKHEVILESSNVTSGPNDAVNLEPSNLASTPKHKAILGGDKKWRPAKFDGLVMGKSSKEDMLKLLGSPERADEFKNTEKTLVTEIWYQYKQTGLFSGRKVVIVDPNANKVIAIVISPTNTSKEDIFSYFGKSYIVTRYAFDECLNDGGDAPIYESQDGNSSYIEYRHLGIAINTSSNNDISQIQFLDGPLGPKESKCP